MRRYRVAAALLAAGCGGQAAPPPPTPPAVAAPARPDPMDPMPVGGEYLLILPDNPGDPVPMVGTDGAFYSLDPGLKVRLVHDAGGDVKRDVTVSLLEGPDAGTAGKVRRSYLKPTP